MLWRVGVILVVAGFILALLAALLPLLAAPHARIGVGGCVVVLFVPVCFGVGNQPLLLLVVAIALSIFLLAIALLVWRTLAREAYQITKHC